MKHIVACIAVMASAALASAFACAQSGCPGDLTGDGKVDGVDLALVLTNWGTCSSGSSITGVYPPAASTEGGTAVAIVGINLGATASISIDGLAVTSFQVVSPTTVTFTAPPAALGTKTIVLRNASSQVLASASIAYAPLPPSWAEILEYCPNPSVVTNDSMRAAITATGLPWRVRDRATQIEMLLVPPGTFEMGCSASNLSACDQFESPQHSVTITRAFYLGRYEVTQAQWTARMGSNPSFFQGPNYPSSSNRPVDGVSWMAIQGFLAATSMRLPTEAEWEFSCRAGTQTAFYNGTSDDSSVVDLAWCLPNSASQTRAVGSKAANALGFHDMLGNAMEFVNDWAGLYPIEPQIDPAGPSKGIYRSLRGGSWSGTTLTVRSSARLYVTPEYTGVSFDALGFRVARNP